MSTVNAQVEKETCNSDDCVYRGLYARLKRLFNLKTEALEKEIQELKKENLELKLERDEFRNEATEATKEMKDAREYLAEELANL